MSESEIGQKKVPFYINHNFALTWIGSSVSSLGDTVLDTTLVLWIVTRLARGQTWAPLAVSGIFLAASIPVFVLGPIAGVFVDRWVEKKHLMMRMDLVRGALIVLLLMGTFIPSLAGQSQGRFWLFLQLGMLYGVAGLVSACSQFFSPASSVLFYDIVEEAYRARASGLFQMIFSIAATGGPPLATLLYFASGVFGVQGALLLDAFSFLISFGCLLLVHVPQQKTDTEPSEEKKSFLDQFREGIRFYVTNSVLMMILITGIFIFAWTSAFQVLGIFFVSQNLHASLSCYGFIGMASGGGFAVGAVIASVFASRVGVTRLFWSAMLVMGLLVMVYSRMTHFLPALCLVFLIDGCAAAINVTVSPIAMHVTPRALIARVVSVLTPVMTLASMLCSLLIGWLISSVLQNFHATILGIAFGPIDTIYFLTGCLALVGGFYAMVKVQGIRLAKEGEEKETDGGGESAQVKARQ
jgi:MFS family permease